MSAWLMKALLLAYMTIMIVCIYEKQYAKATYWLGAIFITLSLIWMK